MNSQFRENVPIKNRYMGFEFMPPMIFPGYSQERALTLINSDRTYFKVTNWSNTLRYCLMIDSGPRDRYWSASAEGCRSGQGMFKFYPGILLDAEENIILALIVNDPHGQPVLMINSTFDTPRCPPKWAAMRKHVRKIIYSTIIRSKVVKVHPEFLNGFIASYNFVPTINQMQQLKRSITSEALNQHVSSSVRRQRAETVGDF